MLFKLLFSLEANGTIELFCRLFLYSSLQRNQKKCNKLKENNAN